MIANFVNKHMVNIPPSFVKNQLLKILPRAKDALDPHFRFHLYFHVVYFHIIK